MFNSIEDKPYPPDFLSEKIMRGYKREAKDISKHSEISLTQAYERVARMKGYPNWHKVTLQRKRDAVVEAFLFSRAVIAFQDKDAPSDIDLENGYLTRDYAMPLAAYRPFVYGYVNNHHLFGSYSHPPALWFQKHTSHTQDVINAGEALLDLEWYRINQDLKANDTPIDVLKRLKPHIFFPPEYISLCGIVYQVRDEQGMFAW